MANIPYTLVEFGFLLIGGVYGTLIGYRKVGKAPGENAAYDAKYNKTLKWFKWGGPALIIWSVVLLLIRLSNS